MSYTARDGHIKSPLACYGNIFTLKFLNVLLGIFIRVCGFILYSNIVLNSKITLCLLDSPRSYHNIQHDVKLSMSLKA